ncbi:DNA mismatch repair protein MSH5 [Fistulifera solaris]|uniref:DNA mismatch repair protein MSH5 n=1 Tax=Fistulifera solaris TaxID=1519565 RepID=A0A1Z5KLI8_FISSO|nr:DNA mismatch repair protein MSH5 [Fistulifera solaris]|eukprot:GAX27184.1 DNA mismatch repair protein MSH5 [Fistulifera solaris]
MTEDYTTGIEERLVCMAVVEDGPRIGFAAFLEESNTIVLEDSPADGYDTQALIERVLALVQPNLLLLSSKIISNTNLLEVLTVPQSTVVEDTHNDEEEGEMNVRLSRRSQTTPYKIMKSSCYEKKRCRSIILRMQVNSIMNRRQRGHSHQDSGRRFPTENEHRHIASFQVSNYHALASLVDFDSTVQVQALGCLLSFLETKFFGNQGGIVVVDDIVHCQASHYMAMNPDTLAALNIFAIEHHPLAASNGYGNAKEGQSLYALLNRTKSKPGRQRLREIMLKPLLDVDAITMRQDGVEFFLQDDTQKVVPTLMHQLRNVGAVDKILNRIHKCCSQSNDILVFTKTLAASIAIISALQNEVLLKLEYQLEQVARPNAEIEWAIDPMSKRYYDFVRNVLQRCHVDILEDLLDLISSMIDEETTSTTGTVAIRSGYNAELDQWKVQYDSLRDTLSAYSNQMQQRWPSLRSLMVLFMPQVGFLIGLENDGSWNNSLPEDFQFVFTEVGCSYFRNQDTRHLDEAIGDLDSQIKDTEALIVSELEEHIFTCDKELRSTFNALAELDCVLAFAACAADQKYVRPILLPCEENCIIIQNGRHPLQEILIDDTFVPNDACINSDHRVNIVTGPNFSGKSCYARQIGIITYMAHIGCFVPCDNAQISVVDHIYARFSGTETCAVPQSSFQLDLTQMGTILRRASPNSLVIIDEFGKGK